MTTAILREYEAGSKTRNICPKQGIRSVVFYRGGLTQVSNIEQRRSAESCRFNFRPCSVVGKVLCSSECSGCDDAIEGSMEKPTKDTFDAHASLAKVGAGKTIVEFEKGRNVFEQGDDADTVYFLQKGKIKVTVLSDQGKEAVVGILERGQFFGESCLTGHKLRISTTSAMERCVVTAITKSAMIAALHDDPAFSELFMAYLLTRNSRIEEDLIDQLFNSSERRLARMLLLLANFGREGAPQPISPNISQETLADMIGTTRSRVSFFMNKFRKLGFINYNGHIEVNISLLSAVLHDRPELKQDE